MTNLKRILAFLITLPMQLILGYIGLAVVLTCIIPAAIIIAVMIVTTTAVQNAVGLLLEQE